MTARPAYALFSYCLLLLLFSCKGKKDSSQTDTISPSANDSTKNAVSQQTPPKVRELTHFDLKNYFVSVQYVYFHADSIRDHLENNPTYTYLIARNKSNNKSDTLILDGYDQDISIEDLSDSLHFPLCLQMHWTGDSDARMSDFVGYWNDTLRSFFSLAGVVSLQRADKWTIKGFVGDRDELVYNTQWDYPVTISLKDFEVVNGPLPAIEYIGYSTIALESIKGYRMINENDSVPYTIKKGKKVKVETLNREEGSVSLTVSDSITVRTKFSEAQGKLKVNDAG